MMDYNFFIIYSKNYQRRLDRNSPFIKAAMVVLLFILVATGLMARNSLVENDNKMKAMELDTLTSAPGYQEILDLKNRQNAMERYDEKASLAIGKLNEAKFIDSQLIKDITGKIPTNISINSINIDMTTLRIEATAPNRKAVAELQLRLKELPFIGDVYVGSIDGIKEGEGTGVGAVLECIIVKEEAAE